MLVLSRKLGEAVVVPALNIRFTVLSVEGKKVRLGITAPARVAVHREEVWDRISEERPSPQTRDENSERLGGAT